MEKKFFKNLIAGNQSSPPTEVESSLVKQFAGAINIEWYKKEDDYEAIFYLHQMEHIARFKITGELIEYKINIPPTQLPPFIIETITTIGEIMSSVVINQLSKHHYEIIVRNKILQRLVVVLDDKGEILDRKFL
ncbi:MAG TPA: hypothetical protein DCQ26_15205 [Marinilabiliales bacterium]|jgi:hypothetical protein|nr:hypothetical protein [Salinivirgaceae bacterium]OFX48701.1 MAG: hypothetical protein A2W95_10945 [Bacteroidetes bacterium GWA2_40_14]OFX57121.1 MAG: hypothetical protein A2W84_13980 [Bacteroidetes bacterium GWC2_40_13]OFX73165.1 MAG: hypothetical protein A2W96_06900 [Bacteroidetes bacterium GWD2_40_43]OFX91720.1 MAG: hypothetical protein A2W97_07660 [Bacteroidetes bacterium GWE2_40_63]OFY24530.1 MAG: hypothetical protein A2W88_17080 [Bacteroidetes bacterium GWF2_40_13]OFZ23831.1 MAG: hypot